MPRYEMDDKFWEIELTNDTFFTRHGKIGHEGQKKRKAFGSPAEAKKGYDAAIAAKTKEGYTLKAGEKSRAVPKKAEARNPDLEALILKDPEDRKAYTVYADWLQDQGELRGELIALQLAGKDKEARKLIDDNVDYFLGALAPHQMCHDGDLGNNNRSNSAAWVKEHQQAFLWKNGFIRRLRLAHNTYADEEWQGKLADVLKAALGHPSMRFVEQLNFNENGEPDEDTTLDDLFTLISKTSLPSVRKIVVGDNVDQISWYSAGKIGKIWGAIPNLRTLEMEAGSWDLGTFNLPELERAVFITGGLSKASMKAIAAAKIPKIKHLEIYFGTDEYGGSCSVKDVQPLLDRTDLPQLTYLGLKNSEFADELAHAVGHSKIVKQLETLDLSLGTMGDEGAIALADCKDALKKLETLDLSKNYLTKKGIDAVKGLAKKVVTDKQRKADDYGDGELHRYATVTE